MHSTYLKSTLLHVDCMCAMYLLYLYFITMLEILLWQMGDIISAFCEENTQAGSYGGTLLCMLDSYVMYTVCHLLCQCLQFGVRHTCTIWFC